jgi:hypothetical protein
LILKLRLRSTEALIAQQEQAIRESDRCATLWQLTNLGSLKRLQRRLRTELEALNAATE